MDKAHIEHIVENKYSLLLFFMVALMMVSIATVHYPALHYTVDSVFSMIVFIILLRILKAHRFFFSSYLILAIAALLLQYLAVFVLPKKALGSLALIVYIFMIGILIVFMIRRIFSERLVTSDTIKGGISVYLMMGTWWQLIYHFLWMQDPHSFLFPEGISRQGDFLYYSISTMTSLGLGDILPRSYPAKMFSMIQAIVGQLYIAVFVARLVGLHVAGHASKR